MYDGEITAKRIKARAKDKKAHLKTMLSDLGVGINLIAQISKGQNVTAGNLQAIADYLDCSVDYLLGRTERPEVNK